VPYLLHLNATPGFFWRKSTGISNPKIGALPRTGRERPDYIGIRPILDARDEIHIFEVKGRHPTFKNADLAKALRQVSAVKDIVQISSSPIRRIAPTTRVVLGFSFRACGVSGKIVDPAERELLTDLRFDRIRTLINAYGWFLGKYRLTRIEEKISDIPNIQYFRLDRYLALGLSKNLLHILQRMTEHYQPREPAGPENDGTKQDWAALTNELNEMRKVAERTSDPYTSIGLDGIVCVRRNQD
jgi:hypothetical protein